MRTLLVVSLSVILAGCAVSDPTTFDETAYGINRRPNTAPRGSDAFCRTYGQQSAANRIESSRGTNNQGPSGFDKFIAREEGERAYRRCVAGRTN